MNTEQTKLAVGISLKLDVPALKRVMRCLIAPASIRIAVVVDQVAAGSAAFRAGVRPGDIIVAVNEQAVCADATPEAVLQHIIGTQGTKVTLSIDRFIAGKTVPVTCVVRRQPTESCATAGCSAGSCSQEACSTGGCAKRACSSGGCSKAACSTGLSSKAAVVVLRRTQECGRCPDLQCPGCPRIA